MGSLIATDIETQTWNSIIESLLEEGWKISSEYKGFDKGIDFDLYELKKNDEIIIFAWDNWFEGEFKCSKERMLIIENKLGIKFKFGEPEYLSAGIIDKILNSIKRK
jgi:hypothetical protein